MDKQTRWTSDTCPLVEIDEVIRPPLSLRYSALLFSVVLCSSLHGCDGHYAASTERARDLQVVVDLDDVTEMNLWLDLGQMGGALNPMEDSDTMDLGIVTDLDGSEESDLSASPEEGDVELPLDRIFARLPISSAQMIGSYSVLPSGLVLLDKGAQVRWNLIDIELPEETQVTLSLQAQVWRYEDGLVLVRARQFERAGVVWGDGRARLSALTTRYDDWRETESYGAGALPPRLVWGREPPLDFIEIESERGGLIVGDLTLHEINARPEESTDLVPPATHGIEYASCLPTELEEECDDGARLTGVIANAPEGALRVTLVSPHYQARTPVIISRSDVELVGRTEPSTSMEPETTDIPPVWLWSPRVGSGQTWPFIIRGLGPTQSPKQITHALTSGQRRVTVAELSADWVDGNPAWVRLGADDFGEVPPVCLEGRDVERYHRHQRQLFRVLEVIANEETHTLVLDRSINMDIPLAARPTLTPMQMSTGVTLSDLKLEADCPEAFNVSTFTQARCRNPEVVDDGGILSHYTDGANLTRISARGFGKFTLELRESLLNQVTDCEMRDPSAYGSGGQGYGVHLIGASRSLILGSYVRHARHGVVVDFGSSDSQIIDGVFSEMNQALIDVHGEASRDTLIRGNQLTGSALGVIVGGGGRAVHCNDGPRHHVIDNQISQCGIGVSISDYTEDVGVRSNSFTENGSHIVGTFGARGIMVERNQFTAAQIRAISLSFEDTAAVEVYRNLFTDLCAEDEATLIARGASPPQFYENLWCP